jgi:uncharacterized membrane protein YfcA
MTALTMTLVVVTMLGTAFLSGVFGMAGGLILMGVLLTLLPLPAAMALHAVTQIASNGWRAVLWYRHIHWRSAAGFLCGSVSAFALWALWQYVPGKAVAFLMLGASPFLARMVPPALRADPINPVNGAFYGACCMSLLLLTGVSGPLMDTFFLGKARLDRHAVVATKAACQVFGHLAKFLYFGNLIAGAGSVDPLLGGLAVLASIIGTSAARPVLERMGDGQYRLWANRIIYALATLYLIQGTYLLATS